MDELFKYINSLGLQIHTGTKARGHQGFFLNNRIDISKNIPECRKVPTLLHEFAHFIHSKIEKEMVKTGGSIKVLFMSNNQKYFEELVKVTNFVDKNSLFIQLLEHKDRIKSKIKNQEMIIKSYYPNFQRSKPFREFDSYIKKSNARYFLKFDRVRIIENGLFFKTEKIYLIDNLEKDFPEIPPAFAACIRLKSYQRKLTKTSSRINRYRKYYQRPSELFARLVEGLYLDKEWTQAIAPNVTRQFFDLLNDGYYMELKNVFKILHLI